MSGIKRDALDAIFSECIRAARNCCEAHGEEMYQGNTKCSGGLECAHIHSRRYQIVRHDPTNVLSLCSAHHRWYTDHPVFFSEFCERYLGRDHLDLLREKLNGPPHKWLKGMKAEARAHYREQLKRVIRERDCGVTGKIDVVGYL